MVKKTRVNFILIKVLRNRFLLDFVSFYLDESSSIPISKSQISSLIIDIREKKQTEYSTEDVNRFVFINIFVMFTNLRYLNFGPSSISYQYLLFRTPPPTFMSSTLLELHVALGNFLDCLYILDGRFSQLRTFHIKITNISSFDLNTDNKVDYFDWYFMYSNYVVHCIVFIGKIT